jgi:LacI family transcriptional regulator
MVLGGLKALGQIGCKVPETMSIVGFDDITIASCCTPPITTIRQDRYEMGYQAADRYVGEAKGESQNRAEFRTDCQTKHLGVQRITAVGFPFNR